MPLAEENTMRNSPREKPCKGKKEKDSFKKISTSTPTNIILSQDESRRELAIMVILHDYPISMVDYIGFRRFVTSLQPAFNMSSQNTLRNDIFKIYESEKAKRYSLLDKLKCRIAITTDMWTSINSKGFMAITGHFIDNS
ncbi:zinc finger BED domain-containing protein DAYSLEEPER-like [Andrographis paniculata]|uniref:zinc finger BED domain-containing protein DAYSLEEPER-like n=1 Tax=Andrographis paniculata TaxID=175694 RepID=UPI0021E7FD9E|nr:zinc finger BED domain-containing protein DAYSLEEPER-like [Andrographis paniculata]